MDGEQLEFDFVEQCKCDETTAYDDLCHACLSDCLEYMQAESDYNDLEEYA